MKTIELGDTALHCPPIGFGCSALMGRSGRQDSLLALGAAWDEGIRFFDTARSYGYGESESLLGDFLHRHRNDALIATKFGILPVPQSAWKNAARAAARKLIAIVPPVHKILRRGAATQYTHGHFTIPVLLESLETSLRKLRTDYVDFLFMHAAPASVLEQDDLLEAMGKLVQAGKVRFAGLSADPDVIELAAKRSIAQFGAMQFPCNIFDLTMVKTFSANNGCALIANHPYGGPARVDQCRSMLKSLASRPDLDPALRAKLAEEEDSLLADVVLNLILRDTGIHVVIPAMMRLEHIRANVRAVEHSRFTSAEIAILRARLG